MVVMDKKREERIKKICAGIQKAFGSKDTTEKVITYLGDSEHELLERFSSGCMELDEALGGGWPRGRMVEIYGPESGGKTTLCYHAIAEFQKKYPDEDVAWIDSEYSLDPEYAEKIGVDIDPIIHNQPVDGNQAFEIIRHLIKSGVKLIVVDSVAALSPREEIEASMEDTQRLGSAARMMAQGLRVLVGEVGRSDVTLIFTNQIRDKPGVMWGEKTTTPGGRSLRFFASIRVDIRAIGQEKDGEVVTSMRTKALIKKNKTAPPLRIANFVISFGIGVDKVAGIYDMAVERGVIQKSGSWTSFGEERIGQGRAASLTILREAPERLEAIRVALMAAPVDKKAAKAAKADGFKKPSKRVPVLSKDEADDLVDVDADVVEDEDAETVVDDA